MFSEPYPTDGEVMTELGDKFLAALVGTIRDTRFDIADMRNWRPGWFPTMHSRCLSNLIHDRIWAHLVTLIASNPGTSIKDKGATREIVVGAHLRLRIKRHHAGDEISTYPTRTAIEFWQQGSQLAFPGLEEVRIAVGYRWDPDTREIGAPLLSLRDGKDHVIWVVELDEPAAGVKIPWTPIEPTLPSIDFGDLGEDSGASGER
ncbi:Hypothetical protein ERS024265_03242 [Mycobacterium tuberculosis]|nr:Hypothetical protein ERS024265_03242 [Mycobacterium tuberculosis]